MFRQIAGMNIDKETKREENTIWKSQSIFGLTQFTMKHYRLTVHCLDSIALQSDKGILLGEALVRYLRNQSLLLPSIGVIERICSEAITRGNRKIYNILIESLTDLHKVKLDSLLDKKTIPTHYITGGNLCIDSKITQNNIFMVNLFIIL